MDGVKRRLNQSVQLKLSFFLSVVILAVAALAGTFSFLAAFDEAHELQDDTLRQIAALLDQHHVPLSGLDAASRAKGGDEDSRVIIQYLATAAQAAKAENGQTGQTTLPLPATLNDGMHTLKIKGEQLRVFVKSTAAGERIAVAQPTEVRDEAARDSALRTVMPFLILVPILLLIVADLVRKMFRPIAALSAEIDQRSEQELHPVQEDRLPIEVRPFAVAINRMLDRVARSMQGQRRFVADAAHELRSPMTALSLQAERLADADMSGSARERLAALRLGIERGRSLLDQLLTLAEVQSSTEAPESVVSVLAIFRRVLEDLMPLAEAKRIDIGVEESQDASVLVRERDLLALVKNLVDNAIRYTPDGGRVDLLVGTSEAYAVLQVRDTGPGIALGERERIFDPFYRTLGSEQVGSGLGLSIVKTIVDRIGGEVRLAFADESKQTGLLVSIRIPMT